MNKQEQIKEMKKIIGNVKPFYVETIVEALYNAGYRNISEYESEIKRLEEKCEELLNEKWDAQDDLDCYYDEMPTRINQAVQDFAEKVKAKSYVNNYCREVVEIEKIDELLKEYE